MTELNATEDLTSASATQTTDDVDVYSDDDDHVTATSLEPAVTRRHNMTEWLLMRINGRSTLSIYHGYGMFIGLAVVSFLIARGALVIRYHIYKDKVLPFRLLLTLNLLTIAGYVIVILHVCLSVMRVHCG